VCRADLSRAVTLVAAPSLTVAATRALACGIPAGGVRAEWLQTRFFHSYQFGGENETIEQRRNGAIDRKPTKTALINSCPLAMPFMFRSMGHQHKALDRSIGKDVLGSPEPSDLRRDGLHLREGAMRSGDAGLIACIRKVE